MEMEPHVVVNGRARALGEVGGHTTLLEWLRVDAVTPAARRAARRVSAVPAP